MIHRLKMPYRHLLIALLAAALCLSASAADDGDGRPVITKKDDLPRHSYQLDIPVTALYENENRDALLALSRQLPRISRTTWRVSTSATTIRCRSSMPYSAQWPPCRATGRAT